MLEKPPTIDHHAPRSDHMYSKHWLAPYVDSYYQRFPPPTATTASEQPTESTSSIKTEPKVPGMQR